MKIKIIGIVLLVIIVLSCIGINAYADYYFANDKTDTVFTTNVNDLTYSAEEKYFMEVNYFSNELNNGEEVFEIRLNYYTDVHLPKTPEELEGFIKNVYSDGVQIVGSGKVEEYRKTVENWGFFGAGVTRVYGSKFVDPYYYNTTNGISYDAIKKPSFRDKWIIDFDGQLGMVEQRGWDERFPTFSNFIEKNFNAAYIEDFLVAIHKSVKSSPNGLRVLQFDLSEWFYGSLYEFKEGESGGVFVRPDTGFNGEEWMFANVKVNRTSNGMISFSQSIFGAVGNDFSWTHENAGGDPLDYWKTLTVYNLTVNDFDFVQFGSNQYYFLGRLNETAVWFLSNFNNLKINLVVDLSSASLVNAGIIFYGLEAEPFRGLNINSITIKSASPATFYYTDPLPANIELLNVNLVKLGGAA